MSSTVELATPPARDLEVVDPQERLRGYHAHIYFGPETRGAVEALLRALRASPAMVAVRTIGRLHDRPVGPHPRPSVQLEIPAAGAGLALSWLALNRGDLTVFVHAITDDEFWDHVHNAMWMGEMLPLVNLECLENPNGHSLDAYRGQGADGRPSRMP